LRLGLAQDPGVVRGDGTLAESERGVTDGGEPE